MEQTDDALLRAYSETRRGEPFEELVRRHGRMVRGVALRILGSPADADDVVQGVFLTLARKAGSLRGNACLGAWLHQVARNAALNLRHSEESRKLRERKVAAMRDETSLPATAEPKEEDFSRLLDAALADLPERYRQAIVLHHLEGLSEEAVASRLSSPRGTVASQLSRGRDRLQEALAHRGLGVSGAVLLALLARHGAASALSSDLVQSVAEAAVRIAAGGSAAGIVSGGAVAVSDACVRAAFLAQAKVAAILLSAVLFAGAGSAFYFHARSSPPSIRAPGPGNTTLGGASGPSGGAMKKVADTPLPGTLPGPGGGPGAGSPAGLTKGLGVDLYGDPLPEGARARMGTIRLRHSDEVADFALSPTGKALASVGRRAGATVLWDTESGKAIWEAHPSTADFNSLTFSPDGKILAVASDDGSIFLLEAQAGRVRWVFKDAAKGGAGALAFSPDARLLASAGRGCVRLLDVETGDGVAEMATKYSARAMGFSPTGSLLAASDGTAVRVWKAGEWKGEPALLEMPEEIEGPEQITALGFDPAGKTLAVAYLEDLVFWDTQKWKNFGRANVPYGSTISLEDGRILCLEGKAVRWIDGAKPWEESAGDNAEERRQQMAGFSLQYPLLAHGQGHVLGIRDLTVKKERFPYESHTRGVTALGFSTGGETLLTTSRDGTLRLWETGSGKMISVRRIEGKGEAPDLIPRPDGKISPDGTRVSAVAHRNHHLIEPDGEYDDEQHGLAIFEAGTGKPISELPVREIDDFQFSADGKRIAALTGTEERVGIWEIASGKEVRSFSIRETVGGEEGFGWLLSGWSGPNDLSSPVSRGFRPNQKPVGLVGAERSLLLFTKRFGTTDSAVRLRDGATGKIPAAFANSALKGNVAALSPDGSMVATGGSEGTIRRYEVVGGKLVFEARGTGQQVNSLAFSADGRILASARRGEGADSHSASVILLSDSATGKRIAELKGHQGRIVSLAFSSDGRWLASGGDDTTALVWEVPIPAAD